jgi:hypothetical protein
MAALSGLGMTASGIPTKNPSSLWLIKKIRWTKNAMFHVKQSTKGEKHGQSNRNFNNSGSNWN